MHVNNHTVSFCDCPGKPKTEVINSMWVALGLCGLNFTVHSVRHGFQQYDSTMCLGYFKETFVVVLGWYSLHGHYTMFDTATIAAEKGTLMLKLWPSHWGTRHRPRSPKHSVCFCRSQQSLCNAPRNHVMPQEIMTFTSLHSILALL